MMAASNHAQVAGQRTRPRMTPPCSQSVSRTARDGDQLDSKEMVPDHAATVLMSSLIGTDDPLRSSQICCSRPPNRRPLLFRGIQRASVLDQEILPNPGMMHGVPTRPSRRKGTFLDPFR